jgi:hypothetical protein
MREQIAFTPGALFAEPLAVEPVQCSSSLMSNSDNSRNCPQIAELESLKTIVEPRQLAVDLVLDDTHVGVGTKRAVYMTTVLTAHMCTDIDSE